ncbi:30S ribosomal protein S6 [bacterium]|nr:30S ribosomal protein S6 [bacterium]
MKSYEVLTVYKANLDAEEVDKNIAKIEETVAGWEGKIEKTDKMGRRKLAYEIEKFNDGFFVTQVVSIPADKVKDLRRALKLNENILRTMILDVTEKAALK